MDRSSLNPDEIERRRSERLRRVALREIPILRNVGFAFLSLGVFLNNRYLLGIESNTGWMQTTAMLVVYCIVSWLLTVSLYQRHPIDVTLLFLVIDVVIWTVVIYQTGGEASWLFFILLIRFADQAQTNFRRCIGFVAWGTFCYAFMLMWIRFVDDRPIATSTVIIRITFIAMSGLYISLTARTAEWQRLKRSEAMRVARDLIRQLEERSDDLRIASRKAEEANAAKSEFLANMSHEMRTPLHGVIGMLQLAIEDEESARRVRQLEMARRSAEALLGTIDDILDFSKIEARKLDMEPIYFSIRELMAETMKPLGVTAASKDLILAVGIASDVPDVVWGDPVRIRQILVNLVGNAIKFTDTGEIAVRVTVAEEKMRFEVRDTGVGIPETKRKSIFEPFEQVDNTHTRRAGGTGLGLAIVARLVEAMDGTLDVRSEPGRGSTFSFVVALQADAIGSVPRHAAWEKNLAGKSAAVIEPSPAARTFLVEMLTSRDMTVTAGASVAEIPRRQFACTITADEYATYEPAVVITSPLEHARDDRLRITRPVMEREVIDAVGAAMGLVRSPVTRSTAVRKLAENSLRILVAEDNLINQEFAAEAVRRLGHDVRLASDGETALAMMKREVFDLVLMDVQMPKLDGLQATRTFRDQEPSGIHTPIVALTAHTTREDRQRCLEAGMDAVLTKPIDLKALEQVVRSVTGIDPIMDAVGGNRKLLARVSAAFARQTPELIRNMRVSVEGRDSGALYRDAHTMKGAVSNFGADASHEIAIMIENAAKEKDFVRAAALLTRLEAAVIALEKRILAAMTD